MCKWTLCYLPQSNRYAVGSQTSELTDHMFEPSIGVIGRECLEASPSRDFYGQKRPQKTTFLGPIKLILRYPISVAPWPHRTESTH